MLHNVCKWLRTLPMNGRAAKKYTLGLYGHIPVVTGVVNKDAILDKGVGSSSIHVDGIDNTVMNQQLGKLVQIGSKGGETLLC